MKEIKRIITKTGKFTTAQDQLIDSALNDFPKTEIGLKQSWRSREQQEKEKKKRQQEEFTVSLRRLPNPHPPSTPETSEMLVSSLTEIALLTQLREVPPKSLEIVAEVKNCVTYL